MALHGCFRAGHYFDRYEGVAGGPRGRGCVAWVPLRPPRRGKVVEEGYEFFSSRQLVTLFSAPNFMQESRDAARKHPER